ncbi:hypothetical protein ACHAWU_005227 [Discostella pseudostelligera]|uniref:Uncharacterized protein n=1 Tax=Discostella pseudostelligera TaxID=259834 RepID=A0ABD3M3R4_9STRA
MIRLGYASFVVVVVVFSSEIFDIGGGGIICNVSSGKSDTTICRALLGRVLGQCTDINSTAGSNVCQEPIIGATQQLIIGIFFVLLTTAVSIKLLIQTRKIEVDGPIPPTRTVSQTTNNYDINDKNDLAGKVIFITGAKLTKQLYELGANIVLGCRSKEKAVEAMRRIIGDDYTDDDNGDVSNTTDVKIVTARSGSYGRRNYGRLLFVPLDLTSLASIHKAIRAFDQLNMPVHALINNAGVMRNRRDVSEDGFEMTMAANHLGHFLLTHLLLPKLRLTAEKAGLPSSVITVSSSLHHNATRPCSSSSPYSITKWWNNFRWLTSWRMSEPGIDLGDLNCEKKKYSLFGQYSQSKLANVMFSLELNRRESKLRLVPHGEMRLTNKTYPQVVSYCLHPGLVRTDFIRDMPWYLYYPHKIDYLVTGMLQKSPRSGAWTTVHCATLDTTKDCNSRNDCYFVNSELQPVADCALNKEDAVRLWELSSDLVLKPRIE